MVKIEEDGDAVIVRLGGDFGQPEADILREALDPLAQKHPPLVVFDLSGLALIASVGVGTILAFNRVLRAHGGRVRLAAPPRRVMASLHFTRIDDILEICGSVEAALKA